MDEPLEILPGVAIPAAELTWRFDPSGGPGGQHANRASSRAELSFDLGASPSVPDDLRARLLSNLGPRARNGLVIVTVDESRSQWRNRAIARKRLERLLREACRLPRSRRVTKPSAAARRRRREEKRRRTETKNLRKRPEAE